MLYGDIDLSKDWLRNWLVAWWYRAITWTNADKSSKMFLGIHLRAILQVTIRNMCLEASPTGQLVKKHLRSRDVTSFKKTLKSIFSAQNHWYGCYGKHCVDMVVMATTVLIWLLWQPLCWYGCYGNHCVDMVVIATTVLIWLLWQPLCWYGCYGNHCVDMVVIATIVSSETSC